MRHVGRQPVRHGDRVVPRRHAQVDVLAEHGELARQVAIHLGQVLEAGRIENGPVLPAHEGVRAAAGNTDTHGVGGFAQHVAHVAHLFQQRGGIRVDGGIQFDHRARDLGFDAIGDGVVGQLGQQVFCGTPQVERVRINNLQFEFDTQGMRSRWGEGDGFHRGLLGGEAWRASTYFTNAAV